MNCEFTKSSDGYTVFPPAFRYDLGIKEDLVEEYGRLEGYNKIPEILPQMVADPSNHDSEFSKLKFITGALAEQGFTQTINYNFSSAEVQKRLAPSLNKLSIFNIGHTGETIKIKNPISDKLDEMRSLLFPQLFQNALHNFKHGKSYGQIFENGSVFYKKEDKYFEELRTAGLLWGEPQDYWQSSRKASSYPVFKLKSCLEVLLKKCKVKGYRFDDVNSQKNIPIEVPEFLHPGQWACLFVRGKYVGVIGSVHPKILEDHKFREPVAYFELNTNLITQDIGAFNKVQALIYVPVVKRDLTFELSAQVQFRDIHKVVNKAAGKLFQNLDLKDIYVGDRLGAGMQAVTVTLYLQDSLKAIEDKTLDQIQEKIFKSIKTEFQ